MIERDKKDVVFSETCTTKLMNIRDKEVSHFEGILCDVRVFTDMCHHFEGNQLQDIKNYIYCIQNNIMALSYCKQERNLIYWKETIS